jgi:hypothetical protein
MLSIKVNAPWWLRDVIKGKPKYVTHNGDISSSSNASVEYGIRPALWLKWISTPNEEESR